MGLEGTQLSDVIGHVITLMLNLMSRLIAKGIIRSYSMRRIAAAVKPPNGIVSNCDVCGGLMFNAQRDMHVNDAYFSQSQLLSLSLALFQSLLLLLSITIIISL